MTTKDEWIDQIRMQVLKVMSQLRRDFNDLSSNMGLTTPQLHLLQVIGQKQSCKVSELAQFLGVQPSAITPLIDRLVQGGLVLRENSEQDRRVVIISLTDQGVELWSQIKKEMNENIKQYLTKLDSSELKMLGMITEKLAKQMQQDHH